MAAVKQIRVDVHMVRHLPPPLNPLLLGIFVVPAGLALRQQFADTTRANSSQAIVGLLDQTLDFLFSPKGGLLRQQLVDATADQIDAAGWQLFQGLGRQLPRRLRPPGLQRPRLPETNPLLKLEPIRELLGILQKLPGFEPQLLTSRLPRLLAEPDLRLMGLELARGLAERGLVRLVRDVLVEPELRLQVIETT
jgi:hypothetical protein